MEAVSRRTVEESRGELAAGQMNTFSTRLGLTVALLLYAPIAVAQPVGAAPSPPNLQGVYQSISAGVMLPGGLRNTGSPAAIAVLSDAVQRAKSMDLTTDPWKMCQPVGPFRMMAIEGTKIELALVHTMVVMLFEDLSHGMMRTIYLTRGHPAKLEPTWLGDSVGHWEGNTLVVTTVGFNDMTWMNEKGAQHSDVLHLVERIRPVLNGRYLEYTMTAEDQKILTKPYSYTRYFKKLDTEIRDDVCEDEE